MAKRLGLLVDSDIFIEYFNHRLFRTLFESGEFRIYYSVVTKKELLSKQGLKSSEKKAIRDCLGRFRMVPLGQAILQEYSGLRSRFHAAGKEDCLVAATALVKKFPLVTRNYRHYRIFQNLRLYFQDT